MEASGRVTAWNKSFNAGRGWSGSNRPRQGTTGHDAFAQRSAPEQSATPADSGYVFALPFALTNHMRGSRQGDKNRHRGPASRDPCR